MKKVLITGGTGFVGANLARKLLHDGHQVNLLVRSNFNGWRLEDIRNDISLHQASLLDRQKLSVLVSKLTPDWIFHLAVFGAYSYQTDIDEMVQTNILGTINLVDSCIANGFEAFINTGSSSEYGFKSEAPSETAWLEPNSHYALTKAAATHYCRYTAQSKNANIHTLRLYSVYGPYEEPTRFIPTLIREGLRGMLPPLVNPAIARDYVYIDDVVDAYRLAAATNSQEVGAIYNVGTGRQTSIGEAVDLARRLLNIKTLPTWGSMEDRIWDSSNWVSNSTKLRQSLNWQPRFDFENGLKETISWVRDQKQAPAQK